MQYLKIQDYILALTVLVSLIVYAKLNSRSIKLLVALLAITLFVELSTPLKFFNFGKSNYILYNIFTPIELTFYAGIFYSALNSKSKQKFIVACLTVALILIAINFTLVQKPKPFNFYSLIVSCACITLFSFTCLLQLYSSGENLRFYSIPMFWVCIGALFFYPTAIFSTGLIVEIYNYNKTLGTRLYKINGILNAVMYSIYLAAILMEAMKQPKYAVKNG